MVGVATAIIGGAQGIGFAIPVDRARRIVDDLLRFGEVRAVWVGVRGKTLRLRARRTGRAGSASVSSIPAPPPPAPACATETRSCRSTAAPIDSQEAFETVLSTRGPGRPLKVVLRNREGERTVTLQGEAPPAGLGLRILREELGLGIRASTDGLRISVTIDRESIASQAGLKSGDSLLALNGTPVRSTEDVDHVLQRDFNKNSVVVEIGRGRFSYSVSLPLD